MVSADTSEQVCALALLVPLRKMAWWQNVQVVFADAGFAGADFERQIQDQAGVKLEIVRRDPDQKGFHVLRKRWLIEQVFGCWGRNRRLSRDYEQHPDSSRATLQVASIHRFLKRLKPTLSTQPPFRYRAL